MVHGRTFGLLCCLLVCLPTVFPSAVYAEDEPSVAELEAVYPLRQARSKIRLVEKFSKIIACDAKIVRVDGFDPDVISVTALAVNQLRVQALKPGVTSMSVVDEQDRVFNIEFFITGDVRHLQALIAQMFPDSSVEAIKIKDSVVLRGWVTQPEAITEIVEVADQFFGKVINQMKVGGVQQVLLKVKVMEVQRSKIRQFGFNFIYNSGSGFISSTPGALTPIAGIELQNGAFNVNAGGIADPTIAFGLVNPNSVFNGFIEALKEENLLKVKAEPILVTTNGRPATLLNGGEFPILAPAGLGVTSVQFKEFGISMEAVPIILGNGRLRLELAPEVSERDFANAIEVDGLRIPALTTRRVNTQVEMKFGQTLVIAGLISRTENGFTSKVPVIGEVPWLGALFSRKSYEERETELIVMVTPEYVAPLNADDPIPLGPGENTDRPTDRELFIDGMLEVPLYGDRCRDCDGLSPLTQGYYQTLPSTPSPAYGVPSVPPTPVYDEEELLLEPQTRRAPSVPSDAWYRDLEQAEAQRSATGVKNVGYNSVTPQKTSGSRGWTPRATVR